MFRRKSSVGRGQHTHPGFLPLRRHKGLLFRPVAKFKNRREVNAYLKKVWSGKKEGKGSKTGEKIADNRYYRVWKHKGQGMVIYMSDKPKQRHGGIRRRSSTGEGLYSKYR